MASEAAFPIRIGRRAALLSAGAALAAPAARAQTPKRGGTLVMSIIPEPPTLVSAFNTAAPLTLISPKFLEGLLAYDFDVNPQPLLATAWATAPDGLSITFTLRQGVTWHDGKPFTSADVAYSVMELLKKFHPRGRSTLAPVTAVDTPDAHTAIFRLSRPAPAIMSALSSAEAPILPKHIYEGTDPLTNPRNNNPIGTGPFRLTQWQRGSFIELERNPTYWDTGKPYLDRLVVRSFTDAGARAAAFERGELQLAGTTPVPLAEVANFRKNPKFTIEERGEELNNSLDISEFNLRHPMLGKIEVRHAIRHAINSDAMMRVVWSGLAVPLISPIPSTLAKFHSADVPRYPFDLARANALLDGAGAPRGADGTRFKIRLDIPTISDVYQREAEFLRQSLRQVGIDVEVRISDVPSFLRRIYTDYDFDMSLLPASVTADPTIGLQRYYDSKAIRKGAPLVNASGYSNPEMDVVLDAVAVENDAAKRKALFATFQKIAMRDLPLIPLAMPLNITIANKSVHDSITGADGLRSNGAGIWVDG